MNMYLLVAAITITITGAIHSIVGEKLLIIPILRLDLPKFFGTDFYTKRILRVVWHLVTLIWAPIVAILVFYANRDLTASDVFVIRAFSILFFVSGVVSLIAGHGKHLSWLAFFIVAATTWLGAQQ